MFKLVEALHELYPLWKLEIFGLQLGGEGERQLIGLTDRYSHSVKRAFSTRAPKRQLKVHKSYTTV